MVPCSRSNCQIFLFNLALAPDLVHLGMAATEPVARFQRHHAHRLVPRHRRTEASEVEEDAIHIVAEQDSRAVGVVGGTLVVVDPGVVLVLVHLSGVAGQIAWVHGDGPQATHAEDTEELDDLGREAILCVRVAPVRAPARCRVPVLVLCPIRPTRDTAGAGVDHGQSAEEKVTVGTISEIVGRGHQPEIDLFCMNMSILWQSQVLYLLLQRSIQRAWLAKGELAGP